MNNGWIGVDLDGTLAEYDDWIGPEHIGKPIPLMVKKVQEHHNAGFQIKIMTARVAIVEQAKLARPAIKAWVEKHVGISDIEVTNQKDLGMLLLYDDRAIQIVPNTGLSIEEFINAKNK